MNCFYLVLMLFLGIISGRTVSFFTMPSSEPILACRVRWDRCLQMGPPFQDLGSFSGIASDGVKSAVSVY
jgi:hypothetical protein